MPRLPNHPVVPRPVIVARISKEKEARGWSLEAQVSECRQWCQQYLKVSVPDADIRYEDGISGNKRKIEQRPGLYAAVQGVRSGTYTHVIFHAVDRGARNLGIMCQILDEMQERGVVVVSCVDNQRSDTASGKSFFQMVAMMAQWQAERTSEQLKAMLRARNRHGLPNGPTPFGIMTGPDGRPMPDTRPIMLPSGPSTAHAGLLAALELRANNTSARRIAGWLNATGYRSNRGSLFCDGSIRTLITNRVYVGEIPQEGGSYLPGDFDPIVPRELWDRVQSINATRTLRRESVKHQSAAYSLGGGVVKCLACLTEGRDASLQVWGTKRTSARLGSLRCFNVLHHMCQQPAARIELLEEQLEWVLCRLSLDVEDARTLIDAYGTHQAQHQDRNEHEAALKQIEARLARQQRLFEMGDWDEERYVQERAPLLAEAETLRRAIVPVVTQHLYDLSDYLRNIALAWRDADGEQKARMVKMLFRTIYVRDQRIISVRPSIEFYPLFRALMDHAQFACDHSAGSDHARYAALPSDALILDIPQDIGSRRETTRTLTNDTILALYAAYQQGIAYQELALAFGIGHRRVEDIIHAEKIRRGVPTRLADRPYPKRGGQQ